MVRAGVTMTGEVIFMGGLLNLTDPIFHLQLYIWSWVFGAFFCVVLWAAWYYLQWKPFKPLHGLYYAFKAGTNAAFTFGSQLYMELIGESEAKCIFDYKSWDYELPPSRLPGKIRRLFFNYATAFLDDLPPSKALLYKFGGVNMDVKIAKRLQDGEWEEAPSVTIGGVPTDIILDADQWTQRNSPQHRAIEKAALAWNEAHPNDQIHSYSKFLRLMHEEDPLNPGNPRLPVPPGIKDVITIPWTRIDASFPMEHQDNEYAGYRRTLAEELAEAEQGKLTKLGIKILVGAGAFAVLLLIFRALV